MRLDRAGFVLQVEHQPGLRRATTKLERLEWRADHTNPNCGPEELRLLEMECCTHHHAFDLNYLPLEDRMREGNLPLARPIEPDPPTIEAFLALAEKILRIKGLTRIVVPHVQRGFVG